ncbi:uncharacterized protein METZ01_LOCUS502469, partial [marine metagenome]
MPKKAKIVFPFEIFRARARSLSHPVPGCRSSSLLPALRRPCFAFLLYFVGGGLAFNAHAVAPVITQGAGPLAVSMKEDNASSWSAPDLNATDSDTAAGSLTWSVETNASNGTATIAGTGTYPTTFTYVPNLNFYGSDSFVAQVSDGASTDTITVNVNVAPGLA